MGVCVDVVVCVVVGEGCEEERGVLRGFVGWWRVEVGFGRGVRGLGS